MNCPNCGAGLITGAQFCGSCGTRMTAGEQASPAWSAPNVPGGGQGANAAGGAAGHGDGLGPQD
ncbi:MAG TPA: zinc-ribbon domain-containing protein, partial [Pyrinomonadaceae bacterium]